MAGLYAYSEAVLQLEREHGYPDACLAAVVAHWADRVRLVPLVELVPMTFSTLVDAVGAMLMLGDVALFG